MVRFFTMVIILTFAAGLALAEVSRCTPLIGRCSYYSCLSQELSCTSQDYPLSFGGKYCAKFDRENRSVHAAWTNLFGKGPRLSGNRNAEGGRES